MMGFTQAAGLLIITSQLPALTGWQSGTSFNVPELAFGLGSLLLLLMVVRPAIRSLSQRSQPSMPPVEGDAQLVFADEAGGEQGLADGQGRVHGRRSVEVEGASAALAVGTSSGRSGMCGKLRCPGEGTPVRKSSPGRCAAYSA